MALILIVDDSFVARKALGKIMTDLGHTVVSEAVDGLQAYTEYAAHRPDIVMMDLNMNGVGGAEATSKICLAFPEAKIIVVSAAEDKATILDALNRGARHYIIKPVTPDKISETINKVMFQNVNHQEYKDHICTIKKAAESLVSQAGEVKKSKFARVLIVDDSAVARRSLRDIVTGLGHVVVGEADNGAQAFVEYTKHKPDLVTMDLTMQGMNGAEATSKIIATFPNAKIIVISAIEERRVVVDALERGARHFIIKPITEDKVSAVLSNVLLQKFDLKKHLQLVEKLKGSDGLSQPAMSSIEYFPAYQIRLEDKLIFVKISNKLTETSCQSLIIEIEEYLSGTPRVLFDFGTTESFNEAILTALDNLINSIEANSGFVKAVSYNQSFVESLESSNQVFLASAIKYLAK